MTTVDPSTGRPLPADAIQRVLFITAKVHVYQIPPLTSTKGFSASSWTAPPKPTAQEIFTARMRIIETSIGGKIKADVVLEDPKTGDLFAAAPYTALAAVQQALDSSRFFAVRVVGEGGMRATLGIGFEERSEAFDFSIALGEVRKVLGLDREGQQGEQRNAVNGGKSALEESKKDFSLKAGESIHVELGGKGRRVKDSSGGQSIGAADNAALFSIKPPPSTQNGAFSAVAPPPIAADVKTSRSASPSKTAQELGFDDGEFGEFQ